MKIPAVNFTPITALNAIGALVALYLLVVLGQTIKHNYDLNNQVIRLEAQKSLLEAQKSQLSDNIQYFGTESFREREARSKLGLQQPGENVIIIQRPSPTPQNTPAVAKSADAPTSNFGQWMNFLFGHQ